MKSKLIEAIKKTLENLDITYTNEIEISEPKDKENGQFSTNIAMKLASILKENPLNIANTITDNLSCENISKIEVKAPGFINFFVDEDYLFNMINEIIKLGNDYGRSDIGNGQSYNIEFVSANPTGILHLGNARGGAYGDSLARILDFAGYDVVKEYYINDAGSQIDNLGLSIQARYFGLCGKEEIMPENGYHGPEILEMAKEIYDNYQEAWLNEPLESFKEVGVKKLLSRIINDLEEYGIKYDVFTSEKDIYKKYSLKDIVDNMHKNGYTYEQDGAIWFKSTSFYDSKDHVLIRNDGNYTYLVPDIANHINKYQRGFTKMIDVLGTDHHGYVARLKGALKANGYDDSKLDVKLLQLVRLMNGEEIVRMSKRTGNTITLKDLIDEVGVNAARYFFTMHSLDTQMDFDMELAKKNSSENPVYYVSYAYARICTILNSQKDVNVTSYNNIKDQDTIDLLSVVHKFPQVVASAAQKELPHLITNYVYELANNFHAYYSRHRLITEDENKTAENMNLIKAVKITIKNALNLIGVEPPEKM